MALPKSFETERTVFLRDIVNTTGSEHLFGWPRPTDEDYALFGRIIAIYSILDFALRYTAEVMDGKGMLLDPWKGKTAKLNMYKTTKAIRSWKAWEEEQIAAFDDIEYYRPVRNLLAHFVIRRFPTEDAFLFMTKSAADFEQVYNTRPPADNMLYGVVDAEQMRGSIPVLKDLVSWCSKLPGDLNNPLDSNVAK